MPIARSVYAKTTNSRIFITDGPATPVAPPVYRGSAKGGAFDWPQGDVSPVRNPSATKYDGFDTVDVIQGQRGLPSLPIEFRYTLAYSEIMALVKKQCETVVSVHFGACGTPDDHNGGWADGHVRVITGARLTTYGTGELGALDSDARETVQETINAMGLDAYDIKPLVPSLQASTLITDEVIDVEICDAISCGACGLPSDGAQVMFALIADSSGSPGLPAKVVYTTDGGATWASSPITSLGLAESPSAFACMGAYLVVVSNASQSHHYIALEDLVAGLGGWTEVTSGYSGSGAPNDIAVVSATKAWIVGAGGYVYLLSEPTQAVTVQDSGSATSQNLLAISAVSSQFAVAVGVSNAVIFTDNGGSTWGAVTGPAVGVQLNAIAAKSDRIWLVGSAAGVLYYTMNQGAGWHTKSFPQAAATANIGDIVFVTNEVGYFAYNDTAHLRGYVYRSIDGGYSWYRLPEGTLAWPTARTMTSLAVPDAEGRENVLLCGGLAIDANDGILIKAA